MHSPQILTKQ